MFILHLIRLSLGALLMMHLSAQAGIQCEIQPTGDLSHEYCDNLEAQGIYDVTCYGAKPDDQRDDTAAIQCAIAEIKGPPPVSSSGDQPKIFGGKLQFPPGIFNTSAPIHLKRGIRVVGSGSWATLIHRGPTLETDATLKACGKNGRTSAFEFCRHFIDEQARRVEIRDLAIIAVNGYAGDAIHLIGTPEVTIDNIRIHFEQGADDNLGIWLTDTRIPDRAGSERIKRASAHTPTITRSVIRTLGDGIRAQNDTNSAYISRNRIFSFAGYGLRFTGFSQALSIVANVLGGQSEPAHSAITAKGAICLANDNNAVGSVQISGNYFEAGHIEGQIVMGYRSSASDASTCTDCSTSADCPPGAFIAGGHIHSNHFIGHEGQIHKSVTDRAIKVSNAERLSIANNYFAAFDSPPILLISPVSQVSIVQNHHTLKTPPVPGDAILFTETEGFVDIDHYLHNGVTQFLGKTVFDDQTSFTHETSLGGKTQLYDSVSFIGTRTTVNGLTSFAGQTSFGGRTKFYDSVSFIGARTGIKGRASFSGVTSWRDTDGHPQTYVGGDGHLVLRSDNGSCWRMRVNEQGGQGHLNLVATPCPLTLPLD